MKHKVTYHPAASPNKPFRIGGKWYTRDEAAALGYEPQRYHGSVPQNA
jgi:hypothetical protein